MGDFVRVDPETAMVEFKRFADLMDLDLDPEGMTEDDRKGFEIQKRIMLDAIEEGHVTVNDDGEPTIHLKKPTPQLSRVTLHEPSGEAFLARDRAKKDHDQSKLYHMLQVMADIQPGSLAKVKQRDLKVIQAVGLLFLG